MTDPTAFNDTIHTQAVPFFETALRLINAHSTVTAVLVSVFDVVVVAGCILAVVMRRPIHRQALDIETKVKTMRGAVQLLSRLEERRMILTLSNNGPPQGAVERRPRAPGPLP